MAITVEPFTGNGTDKIFTPASTILSQSHVRVDYSYPEEEGGDVLDHLITQDLWDVINNSIVFNDAPTDGYIVNITISTDGEGLDNPPSTSTQVANNLNDIIAVSEINDEVTALAGILEKLNSLYADKVTLASLYADKATLDSLYADKAALDAIYLNLVEILQADDNALIATNKAVEASDSAGEALVYRNEAEQFKIDAEQADITTLDIRVKDLEAKVPTDTYIAPYGLKWNQSTNVYSRTGSNNFTSIQSLMRRCVLNGDGTVNYYLDANDSTLKEDGVTPSVLDGSDGNVMVEIPKHYIKYEYITVGDVIHHNSISLTPEVGYVVEPSFIVNGIEKDYRYYPAYEGYVSGSKLISRSGVYPTTNRTRGAFRTLATANGSAWHLLDFSLYEAVTRLAIIEFGTMNIQGALGQGRTGLSGGTWVGGSYIGITGLSNSLGNSSGNYAYSGDADDASADLSFMSYRGCENLFGNVWKFVDGINISNRVPYINANPGTYADDVFTGDYISVGVTMASADGYARALGNSSKGFFPTSVSNGTSEVGTTDFFYQDSGSRVVRVGGNASNALAAGPLCLGVTSASGLAHTSFGAGVSA